MSGTSYAGTCTQCLAKNGELEDTCKQCGHSLHPPNIDKPTAERKLKASDSHPDAPTKKTATLDHVNIPIPDEQSTEQPQPTTMPMQQATTSATTDLATTRIEAMMQAMMTDMKEMKTMMKHSTDEATAAKEMAFEAKSSVHDLRTDVENLQRNSVTKDEMQSMVDTAVKDAVDTKLQAATNNTSRLDSDNHKPTTIVIGGLETMSSLEAESWVQRKTKEFRLSEPTQLYHKGDEFNGLLFATFTNAEAARQAVQQFQKHPSQLGSKNVWCKFDRSIHERARISLLLGLRRQLHLWGTYQKNQMRVDEIAFHLTVDKELIVSVAIEDNKIKLHWRNAEWERWPEFQDSAELLQLVHSANTKLSKATPTTAKGKGKATGNSVSQAA